VIASPSHQKAYLRYWLLYLRLILESDLFPSGVSSKNSLVKFHLPVRITCPAPPTLSFGQANTVSGALNAVRLSSSCTDVSIPSSLPGAAIAPSVRLPTCWKVRGSNPGGGEIFRTYPDRPCDPTSLLYNGYRVFRGGKGGRDVALTTTPPHLVPRSWKSRAIPLLPLWGRVACYRVKHYRTLP